MSNHPMMSPPRPLTDAEAVDRADAMFALDNKIRSALAAGRSAMWDVAGGLAEFDEQNGWTALGYDTLGEWLADPEIGMSRTTFYRLVGVYRDLKRLKVSAKELPTLEPSKVELVLSRVKRHEVKLEDALEDARELGKRDLRIKYLGQKEPEPEPDSEPDDSPTGGTPTEPAHNSHSETSGHLSPDADDEPALSWEARARAFLLELRDQAKLSASLTAELNELLA